MHNNNLAHWHFVIGSYYYVWLLTHAMEISSIKVNSVQNVDRGLFNIIRWYVIIRTFSIEYRRVVEHEARIKLLSAIPLYYLQIYNRIQITAIKDLEQKTNPIVLEFRDSTWILNKKK